MKLSMDDRYNKIIRMLYESLDYITVDEIANNLQISKRNVYYTINDINKLLENNKLDKLSAVYGKGYLADDEQKYFFKNYISKLSGFDMSSLTQNERLSLIYCELFCTDEVFKINRFEEIFEVSRFTVISDINVLKEEMTSFELELIYDNKLGYAISGDEYAKRKAFFYFFTNVYESLQDPGLFIKFNFMKFEIVKQYKRLKKIEKNGVGYYDCVLQGLAGIIAYINKTNSIQFHLNSDLFDDIIYKEINFVNEEFSELTEIDRRYISIILYCGSINRADISVSNRKIESLVIKMNDIYYLLSGINVNEDKTFIQLLVNHLTISILRFRFGVFIDNPLLKELKTKYKTYFHIVRQATRVIELETNTPISESEIGFFVLYYVGYSRKIQREIPKVNAILICANGLSTSYLLKNEIEKLDNRIYIDDYLDVNEKNIDSYIDNVDLVITNLSTVDFKCNPEKIVMINSFLSDDDRVNITNTISRIIFEKSDNYFNNRQIEVLFNEFKDTKDKLEEKHKITKSLNSDVFKLEFVDIVDNGNDYKEVIHNSCKTLVDYGYIKKEYSSQIINNIEKYGSYMVFKNGYLLGHSSIEYSNKLGLSFTKLKNEIDIKGRMVDKVFIFTPNNKIDHIPILNGLVLLLENEEIDKMISESNSKEEIYNIISKLIYVY